MTSDDSGRRRLVVSVTDGEGRALRVAGLGRWLSALAPAVARGAVAIALVDDGRVRRLNRTYRGIDRATDVLSFPNGTGGALGDIVIATGVARRQAAAIGHSYQIEVRTLALHGLLHLLGYDHERDAGEMRRVEERLRRRGGLTRGLIARTVQGDKKRTQRRARTTSGPLSKPRSRSKRMR
jgi:probable rRNA maturation factor